MIKRLYSRFFEEQAPNIQSRTIDSFFRKILLDNWEMFGFSVQPAHGLLTM